MAPRTLRTLQHPERALRVPSRGPLEVNTSDFSGFRIILPCSLLGCSERPRWLKGPPGSRQDGLNEHRERPRRHKRGPIWLLNGPWCPKETFRRGSRR